MSAENLALLEELQRYEAALILTKQATQKLNLQVEMNEAAIVYLTGKVMELRTKVKPLENTTGVLPK